MDKFLHIKDGLDTIYTILNVTILNEIKRNSCAKKSDIPVAEHCFRIFISSLFGDEKIQVGLLFQISIRECGN